MKIQSSYTDYSVEGIAEAARKSEERGYDIFSSSETGAYYFSGGWNVKSIYALLISFIFSAATIWNPDFRFLASFSWIIGGIVGFVMYYLLSEK